MDEAGEHISTATLKAHLDALDAQIANYQPMERSAAIEMVRAFAAEHGLSEASIFPARSTPPPDFEFDVPASRDRPGSRYERSQDE